MTIYRLSIVERDPESNQIIDFVFDYEFRKITRLKQKLAYILNHGYELNQIDVTTWDYDRSSDTYDLIFNQFKNIRELIDL